MIDAADLQAMLQGTPDDPYLDVAVQQAEAFIASLTADGSLASPPPEVIVDRATLDVAADIWHRRHVANGLQQFGDETGVTQAVRIRNDLLAVARPTLGPWMLGGFA